MITSKKTPYTKQGQTRGPHLRVILDDVARHFKVASWDALIQTSGREILLTRSIYCYVAWKLTNATLREIGALIGVDHAAVSFHRNKIQYWINKGDPKWIDEWFDYLEDTEMWGINEKIR